VSERLKGKLAFVTAAGQGIGFAIAEAFLLGGASVIATDLAADKLKNLKTDKIFALDVRSTEKVDALAATVIDKFGAPSILVNCAGYVHQGSVLDCSEENWDFSVAALAVFLASDEASYITGQPYLVDGGMAL
jgi:2-keto-3-deoxy-L-fuconate dehydrogenase